MAGGVQYVERLSIRPRWWLVTLAVAAFGSAELFAGFGTPVVVVVLLAVLTPTLLLLGIASRTVVRVDAVGVHAGRRTMTWDEMESAQALDRAQTRLQIGPEADPAAVHVVRGFIGESVLLRPLHPQPAPYWLVSTRHPAAVVAAIEAAARAAFSAR